MLSKYLIHFSVEGRGCVPSLLFDVRPNSGGGNEDNGDLLPKVPWTHCYTEPPTLQQATTDPRLHRRLRDTYRQARDSLLCHHSFLLGLGAQGSVCTHQESVSPVLCKFWKLYGGVNGDLLQEGLCHTQAYCTQSPCHCGSPLLTRISTRDTQTQLCLSLCGVFVSWCAQGLFEPFEHLWQVWGLILNMISPLLPSCWGFFALGCGDPLTVVPAPHSHGCKLSFTWGKIRTAAWRQHLRELYQ